MAVATPALKLTTDKAVATPNLYQRLNKVAAEVAVRATGKTAQGQRTMSISDVEEALSDLLSSHGVVTGYSFNSKPEIVSQVGNSSLWLADLTVWMVNADDPEDKRTDIAFDVGTSPSAAVSFALKRFYRALFHLADEEDEKRSTPGSHGGQQAPRPAVTGKMSTAEQSRIARLNETLPSPQPQISLDSMLRDLPYDKALAIMTGKHHAQCGDKPECAHVTGGTA